MQEILEEIKELQFKKRGCMPNPRGASPVSRDVGDRSYMARMVGSGRPDR